MNQRQGILAIDVGSGTQDILVWRPEQAMENCPKMILPSATTILAERIRRATGDRKHLFLSGTTMGGGPCAAAARAHLEAGLKIFAVESAALTFHDNLDRVRAMGIQIVASRPDAAPLEELSMGDVDLDAIHRGLALFHVAPPELVAVSVQDHGFSPNESNRAFRFRQWTDLMAAGRGLESLLYRRPPEHLTRMRAVVSRIPHARVMDTGASAILGALMDPWISQREGEGVTVVNVGNEHTVAALIKGEKLWGVYEHHTSLMTPEKLADHLHRFRKGRLPNREVFEEMGHGCRVLPGAVKASPFEHLGITGPNRARFLELGGHMAAPHGDMMLTGCFGLVEAVKRQRAMGGKTDS